jgi:hypothetical protein
MPLIDGDLGRHLACVIRILSSLAFMKMLLAHG